MGAGSNLAALGLLLSGLAGQWVMENKGDREAGKCSKMVSDRGDRLSAYDTVLGEAHRTVRSASSFLLFFFGRPIIAPLIMDQGASVRHFYWRRGHRIANTIGAGGIGSPIIFVQGASVRQYYWRRVHRIANSIRGGCIGALIILKLILIGLYKRETEIR